VNNLNSNPLPLISVIVCTHNRADHLFNALQSLVEQLMPRHKYEIIIVDNASKDETPDVVRHFESAANIRYVYEGVLGLCHARNTGWHQAKGHYIAYLDDDAIASPQWLTAIEEGFASTPSVGVVGGPVNPIWEGIRPQWLSDEIAPSLTIIDWSNKIKVISDVRVEWLVGTNMAVSSKVMERVGGFHPSLDRVGKRMLFSGDVFLQKQVIREGYLCLYHPDAVVRHLVPQSRLKKRWFIRRYYSQGLSDAVMQLIEEKPNIEQRLRISLSKVVNLLRSPIKVLGLLLPTSDPKRFTEQCFKLILVGHIMGLLGALRK
jgi:glycosyltransferase involved in cell wall biosynthesis